LQSEHPDLETESGTAPPAPQPMFVAIYSLTVGLAGLGLLVYGLVAGTQQLNLPPILLFAILSLLVQRSSFHFGTQIVHSLTGVIDIAAVLALGPVSGALVAAASGLAYLVLDALNRRRLTRRDLLELPVFDGGLKAMLALGSGSLFQALAGPLPLAPEGLQAASDLDARVVLGVTAMCLFWFAGDHLAWGVRDYLEGGSSRLRLYIHHAFPEALLAELLPLPFGFVVAVVYARLHWTAFILLALAIVAVAILTKQWADTRSALTQRVRELTTIEQIGRAVAQAHLDVDELCALLYEHVRGVADATIFQLGLFRGDDYDVKLWIREGETEPPRSFRLAPGVGLVQWLRDSKEPILIRDFAKEMSALPARPVYVSDHPPRSALFVPLMASETAIGTMSIQSYQRHAYGESDLRLLLAMANEAAVAIQKAWLYADERKRVRQLETIGRVSRQVTATLELDELFEQTAHLIRSSFGYYHVAIYAVDEEHQAVTFQASASAGEQNVTVDVGWDQGLVGWVAAHAQAVTVNDVESDTRYRCIEALEETRSELAVPLCLENELVGVLDVQSDQANAFGPDDVFILETLGDQVAIAIHEARLYEAQKQQAWLSTALLQIADATSRLSDMDAVLTTIVRLTPLLVGVDRCAILLWDEDTETFVPAQTHGLNTELRATFDRTLFPTGAMPALDVLRYDRAPLLINADRDGLLIPSSLRKAFDIREMALLPLMARGEFLGVMLVDFAGEAGRLKEQHLEMLTGIANQAAMVIKSARLVQSQQEEAYVSMALLQVAEAVSRSSDLEDALSAVVRITPMLVGVEACAVFLLDRSSSSFVPFQQYGLEEEARSIFWQLHVSHDDPALRQLADGQPFLAAEDLQRTPLSSLVTAGGSVRILPLVIRGDMVGLMSVNYAEPVHRVTLHPMNILAGIAGQAAIAVENDRLLREAAEQERMRQELEVARHIQSSFLPESYPSLPGWELATIWRSAREVAGDFYDFVPLHAAGGGSGVKEGRIGVVVADVADKGVPAALFMALSRTLVRTMAIAGRSPAPTARQANNLILADARSDLFVTLLYAILEPNSGEITYVNAGHMPPMVVRADDGSVEEPRTHGMAMGVLRDIEYEDQDVHLEPGDLLLLYTDGIVEASGGGRQMFGRERLREVASKNRAESAAGLAECISGAVDAFVGDAPQFDDLTLVVAKRVPPDRSP
jgi:serine phosphatase RsbU (regulator of sigma subunit)/signal transduction protein with GAF and PtsI domain